MDIAISVIVIKIDCIAIGLLGEKCVKRRTANEESNIHWIIQHENLTDPEITAFC